MKIRTLGILLLLFLVACGGETVEEPAVSKDDVAGASGKGDTADLDRMCADLDRDAGCDPCAVQGWYGDGTCDSFCPVNDSDCGIDGYTISVVAGPELSSTMSLVYQSSDGSLGCTDLSRDGFEFRRVPEQIRETPEPACTDLEDGSTECQYQFPNELGDECSSVIRHIYLEPRDRAGTMDPWASLAFVDDAELEADAGQVVGCEVIMSGPGGDTPTMMCGNDLLYYDASGRANVELVLSADE